MKMETQLNEIKFRPKELLQGVRYPDADRLARYMEEGILGSQSLRAALRESFRDNAHRNALVGPEGEFTYEQFDDLTDRFGAALLRQGARPLDPVILQCGNCNELLIAFVGCLKAALIPLCALQAFRKHEISYLGNLCEAAVHIVQGDDAKFDDVAFAEEMQENVPSLRIIVQARGEKRGKAETLWSLADSVDRAEARRMLDAIPDDPFQVAVFQLSGGTTGVPKIIPRFQNDYLLNMREVAKWNDYNKDDVLFMPTPFMHNMNMACFFGPMMLVGASVTVCPDIRQETLCGVVERYKPTWFGLAGPILSRITETMRLATDEEKQRRKLIGPKNAPRLRDMLGSPCYHIFGMTEGVIMFAHPSDPQAVLDESVGRPVSAYDEVRIVEPGTDTEVPDGEIGEALFRGPYTIRGYFKSEKEDVHRFTADGFYRSGDLMMAKVIDGKRYFYFRGRTKDVVDRGGEKINAEELENLINTCPRVHASAIVGMPDPVYGEKVCAFIVPKPGQAPLTLRELTEFLQAEGLAKFKWPERVEIISEFPVTASGKLSKVLLRKQVMERLDQERTQRTVTQG
ncbi:AMP-dependent synthetase and ligase [Caballeronia pedi]|uniref:AMP-dependent synthetase and ligase n=1 Tax=Caballeronia pedi TaxID=1777141 RepID=A0A158DKE6_9BURK|nr:AMP-dependent synthetase and ligase [Caballeronia pedi]